MRRLFLSLACLAVFLVAAPALAQDDEANSKDHPMVSRFPGYYIYNYDAQDFGAFDFYTAEETTKHVEGRYWKIEYQLKENAKKGGPIEIGRNYVNLFTNRGGVKLVDNMSSGGGTMVVRMPAGGKNIWLQVEITNSGELYTLTIVEEAGMEQKVEFTAMDLAKALNEKGSVAIHGILFDTGKATIKPESAAAMAPIGELLKSTPALKLEIQGHTDNVGAAAANLKLSQDRAAAVKAYVVSTFGIAADRLTTAGFGDTKPVGDNKTDAGRAANRRVELVKK
jgi:outer membrane protein OmpA-like peptidoglycan-associated protein